MKEVTVESTWQRDSLSAETEGKLEKGNEGSNSGEHVTVWILFAETENELEKGNEGRNRRTNSRWLLFAETENQLEKGNEGRNSGEQMTAWLLFAETENELEKGNEGRNSGEQMTAWLLFAQTENELEKGNEESTTGEQMPVRDWERIRAPDVPMAPPVRINETFFWRETPCNISHLQSVTVCQSSTAENMAISMNRFCSHINNE